ncbi:hypothetical protein [Acetobacter orientalis]|uniref:hypothetical protein n=1 Tax=Acetobacter orientalis TaxID=146474 RepID=UPI0039EBA03B
MSGFKTTLLRHTGVAVVLAAGVAMLPLQAQAQAQAQKALQSPAAPESLYGAGATPNIAAPDSTAVCDRDGPCITPATDADIVYELTSPVGDAAIKQRMRWQVAALKQRLDPENTSVYMVTSWPEHTLSVVDLSRKRFSVMPAPSQGLTPPGHIAMTGTYARLGSSIVAGERCTVWRTKDTDGHASDVCYTPDGLLLQVAQGQQITVRALSVSRATQPDTVFTIPAGLKQEAPATP